MVQILSAAVVGDLLGGLGINTIAFLSQLVSFGIVFWLLWKWGLPAITRTIDKRNAVISEGVENAEKARKALEDAKKDAEQFLLEARRQGQETIAQATRAAENEATRIREEAEARSKANRTAVCRAHPAGGRSRSCGTESSGGKPYHQRR